MKVVWLCTFTNPEKRRHLSMWRKPGRSEIGQWIPNLLKGFYGNEEYELHVITIDHYMLKNYETWKDNNITYHCFQPLLPLIGYCPKIPIDAFTSFWWNRHRIVKLIKKINPDLIHLFGVENPQYGSAVLDLPKAIPLVCTIQGFVSRELHYANSYRNFVRARFENLLLKRVGNYLGDYDSEQYVKGIHKDITYGHMYFPVNEDLIRGYVNTKKKYDALFAGSQTQAKGFGDFLKICAYCKKRNPTFKAVVVGTENAYAGTADFITKYNLENVIVFTGLFPTQEGLFAMYEQAKIFLAPTYNDAFPSTIRENMLIGTVCIAYKTGGIPYVNSNGTENVVIVDKGDWQLMADKVLDLIADDEKRNEISKRAKSYAQLTFSLKANVDVIKNTYMKLLAKNN